MDHVWPRSTCRAASSFQAERKCSSAVPKFCPQRPAAFGSTGAADPFVPLGCGW
jgi:hypothetical protein